MSNVVVAIFAGIANWGFACTVTASVLMWGNLFYAWYFKLYDIVRLSSGSSSSSHGQQAVIHTPTQCCQYR